MWHVIDLVDGTTVGTAPDVDAALKMIRAHEGGGTIQELIAPRRGVMECQWGDDDSDDPLHPYLIVRRDKLRREMP
jgi:hypothetical protein